MVNVAVIYYSSTGNTHALADSREVVAGFAVAAALLAAFARIETRLARAPVVPFSVFRSRPLSAGNLLSFLSFAPVMATWFFLTLYLQGVRGYTPMHTGLLFVPMALAVVGGSQVSFRLVSRLDARALFLAGGLVAAGGLGWLGRLTAGTDPLWVILPASVTMAGGGLMFAPIMVAATSGAAREQEGLASGLLNTTRQIGGAVGLAVLGTIAAARTSGGEGLARADALCAGYATALSVGAAVFVATAITGALALPARVGRPTPSDGRTQPKRRRARRGKDGSDGKDRRGGIRVTGRCRRGPEPVDLPVLQRRAGRGARGADG